MNRFIIVDGLPYLFADGKAFACRWDDKGFTVGAEVNLTAAPDWTYSELSILAKCAGNLDSINPAETGETEADDSNQPAETGETEALEKLTVAELKKIAADAGIEVKARSSKAEIIAAIKENE